MSFFSMFALYPRSGYYSGAALEVRSVALLQVASFAGNMLQKSLKTHKIALNQQKITKTLA